MTSDGCNGLGQCQKDEAIRNAQREALRGMGVQVVGNGEWTGARETASQRLVFEGLKTTEDGGIRASATGVVATDIRGVYSARSREATNVLGGVQSQARTFTREEVLTVLKTLRAGGPDGPHADAVRSAYDIASRTFERME